MKTENLDVHVLFRFSKKIGLVENDNLAGAPYYIDITDLKTLPAPVEAEPVVEKKKLFDFSFLKPQTENVDLRYRLPGTARIKVYDMENTLTQIEVPLAQFGRIENVKADLFNKKLQTSVLLSPITGALVRIDMIEPEKK